MANLKLRSTTSATDPGSTSAKGSALTHAEMDSNFILLQADINSKVASASPTLTGNITIDAELRLNDADDSNYVAIKAPDTVTTNYTLKLPTTAGTSGQVMTTDGSGNLSFTSKTVDTTDLVSDTSPQLGGDLDTQTNALTGTDVLPSTGSYGGQATGTGGGVRLHTSGSDHMIRTQQTGGKSNIVLVTDIDGSHSAGNGGSGLIYSPLNIQVRDDGHPSKTRTTFDIGVPYRGDTGTTITQGSVTGKLLDVVAGTRKIYLHKVAGGSFTTSATTGKVTGTVTAVNSIGTNAVELTYDTDFNNTAVEADLANVGFARFSARDVLNTPEQGLRASEPELHFEAGRIAFESNGTKQIDITDAGAMTLVTRSNGNITIEPNGTGVTNMKNVRLGAGDGGLYIDGVSFADVLQTRRQSTTHNGYSLEVASDTTNTNIAAGQPGGCFGLTHYSDNYSNFGGNAYYIGSINGVVGDEGTLDGSAGENNNGIRLITYQDQQGFALNTVAEFKYATSEFMKGNLKFSDSSNTVTIETTTSNDNLKLKTTGSTGYIMLDNIPTSDPGVAGALWRDGTDLKISI